MNARAARDDAPKPVNLDPVLVQASAVELLTAWRSSLYDGCRRNEFILPFPPAERAEFRDAPELLFALMVRQSSATITDIALRFGLTVDQVLVALVRLAGGETSPACAQYARGTRLASAA